MSLYQHVLRGLALMVSAYLIVGLPSVAQAQNSPEAIEAVRKHRAQQAGTTRVRSSGNREAYRSGGNPNLNPNASLLACLNHYDGMNLAARTRCYNQHCKGRWGQGDCPAGNDMVGQESDASRSPYAKTALGICLTQAGRNPFKRDACGWQHCNNRRDAPECAALMPHAAPKQLAN